MSLKANFELLATYNQWMNASLYKSAATLSADELALDRGAFFASILGTLNHILVGDTLWFKRFAEHPYHFKSLEVLQDFAKPDSLADIIHSDFEELTRARFAMDRTICAFSRELSDELPATRLAYRNSKGESLTKNFGNLLQHLFNHQTHHRGQASTLLFQAGVDIGITDLLVCIPDA